MRYSDYRSSADRLYDKRQLAKHRVNLREGRIRWFDRVPVWRWPTLTRAWVRDYLVEV
jgi:hypothetical protein